MMPVAYHQAMALFIGVMLIAFDVLMHLPLDGRLKSASGLHRQDVVNDRRSRLPNQSEMRYCP